MPIILPTCDDVFLSWKLETVPCGKASYREWLQNEIPVHAENGYKESDRRNSNKKNKSTSHSHRNGKGVRVTVLGNGIVTVTVVALAMQTVVRIVVVVMCIKVSLHGDCEDL